MKSHLRRMILCLSLAAGPLACIPVAPVIASDELAVAVVGPMSGRYGGYGAEIRAGVEQAVEDLNRSGGVGGRRLTLRSVDDGCSREQALAAARGLLGSGVRLVIGHFCASASLAAAPIYADAGLLQISPVGFDIPDERDRIRPVFRMSSQTQSQGKIAGRFLALRYAGRRIAILHDRTLFGHAFAEQVRQALRNAGTSEFYFAAFRPGEKDYTATIQALKAGAADLVVFGGYPTEAALIVRQMRELGLATAVLLGADALADPEYWSLARDLADGTLVTFRPDASRHSAGADIVRRLNERGIKPDRYALHAYAAVEAWSQAVDAAGSPEAGPVTAALMARPARTVLGDITFDSRGESSLPSYAIHVWKAGALVQID